MIIALPINVAFVILLLLIIAVCIMADCEVWIGISTIPGIPFFISITIQVGCSL